MSSELRPTDLVFDEDNSTAGLARVGWHGRLISISYNIDNLEGEEKQESPLILDWSCFAAGFHQLYQSQDGKTMRAGRWSQSNHSRITTRWVQAVMKGVSCVAWTWTLCNPLSFGNPLL